MKEITLPLGLRAKVDDEDYDFLNKWKWSVKNGYAHRSERIEGKTKNIPMHREIMQTPEGMVTDHRDHNPLNNQKSNLRICTSSQNQWNRLSRKKYKGVCYNAKTGMFVVSIKALGHVVYASAFKSEEKAARKYDEMAKIYHGEFAYLNFR